MQNNRGPFDKVTSNIIVSDLNIFPLRYVIKQRCWFYLYFNKILVVLAKSNKVRKRCKRNPNRKRELNLLLFAEDMIICTENPKDATKNTEIMLLKCQDKIIPTRVLHFCLQTMTEIDF